MDHLRIHFLGGVEVYRGDVLLPAFPTRKSLSLFAFLVLRRGRPAHRDTLCGQFWGDHSDAEARKALRTCLWRIRSVIEPVERERGALLRVQGGQVGFVVGADTWADAWEFDDCLRAGADMSDPAASFKRLEQAVALYRGELLEGVFDEWCLLQRERLRLAYLTALERLVGLHARQGRWLEVIVRGKQILQVDPLREHIHRVVMESHFAMGDRPSALRQFESCRGVLRQELGIDPMEATRSLRDRIQGRETPGETGLARSAGEGAGPLAAGDGVGQLAAEVDAALEALYALTERLEGARLDLGGEVPSTASLGWPHPPRDLRRPRNETILGRS